MDGSRFDDLARLLSAQRSRRGMLGALAGAMLGAAGLSRSADAKSCRSLGNACAANGDCCSNNCVTESRTRKICHCSVGSDCPAGDQCHAAVCTAGSCDLQVTLGVSCNDGNRCTTGDICQPNGSCAGTPVICDDQNACTTDACNPATGQCVYTVVNCDDGNACTLDTCDPIAGCLHRQIDCNDNNLCTIDSCDAAIGCVHTPVICDDHNLCTIDTCQPAIGCVFTAVACPPAPNECFTAGTCQSGSGLCSNPVYHGDQATCSAGVCHANACCTPEDKAATCAGGKCGPQTNNCGQMVPCLTLAGGSCAQDNECCSGICVTDSQCLNGVCQAGPVALGGACDSNGDCASHSCCGNVCRDVSADPDHCGACATVCSNNNMATRTCSGGVCNGTCTPGFSDCNGNKQTDGCEIDILHDHQHCGNCSTICPVVANGDAVCSDGTCGISCHVGFTNCSGHCVNLDTDPDHCGACTTVCSNNNMATRTCSGGICNGTCAGGYADCNGNKQTDGCETHIAGDAGNCGSCNHLCTGANAAMTCLAGACQVAACFPPFADCDGNPANGCETNTNTSNSNCGSCSHVCTGTGQTCCGGGTPGICDCTPESSVTTCAGGKCGINTNNCGQLVNCGGCGTGRVCASDGSMCKSTNPSSACADKNAFCDNTLPACGSNQLGTCACVPTVEGGGICEGGSIAGDSCTSSAQCPGAALCVEMSCAGFGKFCMTFNPC